MIDPRLPAGHDIEAGVRVAIRLEAGKPVMVWWPLHAKAARAARIVSMNRYGCQIQWEARPLHQDPWVEFVLWSAIEVHVEDYRLEVELAPTTAGTKGI